jgi:hypothetical protein
VLARSLAAASGPTDIAWWHILVPKVFPASLLPNNASGPSCYLLSNDENKKMMVSSSIASFTIVDWYIWMEAFDYTHTRQQRYYPCMNLSIYVCGIATTSWVIKLSGNK